MKCLGTADCWTASWQMEIIWWSEATGLWRCIRRDDSDQKEGKIRQVGNGDGGDEQPTHSIGFDV